MQRWNPTPQEIAELRSYAEERRAGLHVRLDNDGDTFTLHVERGGEATLRFNVR
jgi:hypothetical protein